MKEWKAGQPPPEGVRGIMATLILAREVRALTEKVAAIGSDLLDELEQHRP